MGIFGSLAEHPFRCLHSLLFDFYREGEVFCRREKDQFDLSRNEDEFRRRDHAVPVMVILKNTVVACTDPPPDYARHFA